MEESGTFARPIPFILALRLRVRLFCVVLWSKAGSDATTLAAQCRGGFFVK